MDRARRDRPALLAADRARAAVDDDDVGCSLKCAHAISSDSVGGVGDVPTGRPKDGGGDTESQKSMTTITMMTTNKKVMLGTVDILGSAGRGTEDVGWEDSVRGVIVGSCKSVRFDVEGFKSNAYTTINTKRRRQMTTTEDNDDSTTSHAQRRPLDAPVREKPPCTFPHEVQRPTDRQCENRCRSNSKNPGRGQCIRH